MTAFKCDACGATAVATGEGASLFRFFAVNDKQQNVLLYGSCASEVYRFTAELVKKRSATTR